MLDIKQGAQVINCLYFGTEHMRLTCQLFKDMREQATFIQKTARTLSLRLVARSDSRRGFWTKLEKRGQNFLLDKIAEVASQSEKPGSE